MIGKLFLPHPHNNHKAKLRTSKGIIWLAILALIIPFGFRIAPSSEKVLGYATSISDTEIVRLTNEERLKNGLIPLKQNAQLNQAAFLKGQDMFKYQYWAHISPSGVQPWAFISQAGYVYAYAGENLARDFGDSKSVVDAWMNSPTHKENILNVHYKEIGVSVVNGILNGVETTLVIQEFGQQRSEIANLGNTNKIVSTSEINKNQETASLAKIEIEKPITTPTPTNTPLPAPISNQTITVVGIAEESTNQIPVDNQLKISPINLSQAWSVAIAITMIVVFALDWWLVSHKKIPRMVGKSWAHIMILVTTIIAILATDTGLIR